MTLPFDLRYALTCNDHALHLQARLDGFERWYQQHGFALPDAPLHVLVAGRIELEQRLAHYQAVVAAACAPWFEVPQ